MVLSGGWGEVKRLKEKEKVRKWLKSLESKQFATSVSNFKRQTNWMSKCCEADELDVKY